MAYRMRKLSFTWPEMIIMGAVLVMAIGIVWRFERSAAGESEGWRESAREEQAPPLLARVEAVQDALTIKLDSGHRVRFLGVRPPSIGREVHCYGREALMANEGIIGETVRLETDPLIDRAADGAWIRYVWLVQGEVDPSPSPQPSMSENQTSDLPELDALENVESPNAKAQMPSLRRGYGRQANEIQNPNVQINETASPEPSEDPKDFFINERMVETGFAFPLVSDQMVYGERILSAARFASATKKGLWGACEVAEAEGSGLLETQVVDDCVIKGKKQGEKLVYRTKECANYGQTVVLQSQGDKWLCSEEEAENEGFQKAVDCN
jgi:endonuclease YncB( thermonuclease family)